MSLLSCREIENSTEKIANELADDYADYLKVDMSREKKLVEDATDELLTKLEELMSLVDLVKSDSLQCFGSNLPKIQAKCSELEGIFHNIDKLEAFVDMVRENVDVMESLVAEAEHDLLPEKPLSKIFKPLFSKKSVPRQVKVNLTYEVPAIFETNKHLKSPSGTSS